MMPHFRQPAAAIFVRNEPLPPGEDGLFELADPRAAAVHGDFTKLMEDDSGGCVNVGAEHGDRDDRSVTVRNRA
jgi:hypothetical protein